MISGESCGITMLKSLKRLVNLWSHVLIDHSKLTINSWKKKNLGLERRSLNRSVQASVNSEKSWRIDALLVAHQCLEFSSCDLFKIWRFNDKRRRVDPLVKLQDSYNEREILRDSPANLWKRNQGRRRRWLHQFGMSTREKLYQSSSNMSELMMR